jgi:hypothetical protein
MRLSALAALRRDREQLPLILDSAVYYKIIWWNTLYRDVYTDQWAYCWQVNPQIGTPEVTELQFYRENRDL